MLALSFKHIKGLFKIKIFNYYYKHILQCKSSNSTYRSFYFSIYPSIYQTTFISIYLSIHLTIYLSAYTLSISLKQTNNRCSHSLKIICQKVYNGQFSGLSTIHRTGNTDFTLDDTTLVLIGK